MAQSIAAIIYTHIHVKITFYTNIKQDNSDMMYV